MQSNALMGRLVRVAMGHIQLRVDDPKVLTEHFSEAKWQCQRPTESGLCVCAAKARIVENTILNQHYPLARAGWRRAFQPSKRSYQVGRASSRQPSARSDSIVFYMCLKAPWLLRAWVCDGTIGWYVNENGQQDSNGSTFFGIKTERR